MAENNCRIEGQIEEVKRLLNETNANKESLEKRLKELTEQLTPEIARISRAFREFSWYGFVTAYKETGHIYVELDPSSEIHFNGVAGAINKVGYHIHSLEKYKSLPNGDRVPTKILLAKN